MGAIKGCGDGTLALEHWDEKGGKWVLYRSQEEHSNDCAKYPYEMVPGRVFLDTNVINLLVEQSDKIFEQLVRLDRLDRTRAEDTEALMHIFYVAQRAYWEILASRKTLQEIGQTKDDRLRARLETYAIELVDTKSEDSEHAASLGRRMIEAPFTAALPDRADRELIGNAIGFGCDVFCTRDRRTIIRKREQLRQLPIRILTPREWWAHIKPWAGLCM